jgi:hypothetical protein
MSFGLYAGSLYGSRESGEAMDCVAGICFEACLRRKRRFERSVINKKAVC